MWLTSTLCTYQLATTVLNLHCVTFPEYHQWDHILLNMAYFTKLNTFDFHSCCCMHDSGAASFSLLSIYSLVCMYQLVIHVASWRTCGLFLVWDAWWLWVFSYKLLCECFHFTWIAILYGKCIFDFIRNCETGFQSSRTTLHSYQQCVGLPIAPYPCQYMLLLGFSFSFKFQPL